MPNQIDGGGLQVKTISEVVADLTTSLKAVYGDDINVEQNSPDGQNINIFGQAVVDVLELLLVVYNTFSVPDAFGVILDQRVALNGLARRAGTFTTTPVDITVDQALTLFGLDQSDEPVYAVKDDDENIFLLVATTALGGAGTSTLTFRAEDIGQVEVVINTIVNQSTTVLGVTVVNNPTVTGVVKGEDEETDSQLKIRHARSFYLASISPTDSIEAALLAVENVIDAIVIENDTDATVDGTPAHSIWSIVRGDAALDADIAFAIYAKKNPGCGMRGAVSDSVVRPNGTTFVAKWDIGVTEALHIEFGIIPRVAGESFDEENIKLLLSQTLSYRLNQIATIGDVVNAMADIAPNAILTTPGVGDDGITFGDTVSPTDASFYFEVDPANIDIL